MKLVLFDIDGTLICSSRIGREVVALALSDIFGTTGPIEGYSFAGKTDNAIILDLMTTEGYPESEIRNSLPLVYQHMKLHAQRVFPGAGLKACPGIIDLLHQLTDSGRVILGLQTGNIRLTAPLKLQAAAIEPELFSIGAFGSDVILRPELIPIAWDRARRKTGVSFSGSNTIVIGDTPADVECAKVNGATSVAVSTGSYSGSELAKSEPTYLLEDLVDASFCLDSC